MSDTYTLEEVENIFVWGLLIGSSLAFASVILWERVLEWRDKKAERQQKASNQ